MAMCTVLITISLSEQWLVVANDPNELPAAALDISMSVRKAGLSQGTTSKVVLSEHTYVPTYDRPISVLTPPCELASTVTCSLLLMTFFSSLHHCYNVRRDYNRL